HGSGRSSWLSLLVLPPRILDREIRDGRALDAEQVTDGGVSFAQDVVEPIRTSSPHMTGELPDGPHVRGGLQEQLVGGEVAERVEEQAVVVGPPVVEGLLFGSRGGHG